VGSNPTPSATSATLDKRIQYSRSNFADLDSQAKVAIAAGLRKAYAPLFDANENAHKLTGEDLRGLIAQVAGADKSVASKIAGTFNSLVKLADFNSKQQEPSDEDEESEDDAEDAGQDEACTIQSGR
jgi:Family of unknown function (DUF5343)